MPLTSSQRLRAPPANFTRKRLDSLPASYDLSGTTAAFSASLAQPAPSSPSAPRSRPPLQREGEKEGRKHRAKGQAHWQTAFLQTQDKSRQRATVSLKAQAQHKAEREHTQRREEQRLRRERQQERIGKRLALLQRLQAQLAHRLQEQEGAVVSPAEGYDALAMALQAAAEGEAQDATERLVRAYTESMQEKKQGAHAQQRASQSQGPGQRRSHSGEEIMLSGIAGVGQPSAEEAATAPVSRSGQAKAAQAAHNASPRLRPRQQPKTAQTAPVRRLSLDPSASGAAARVQHERNLQLLDQLLRELELEDEQIRAQAAAAVEAAAAADQPTLTADLLLSAGRADVPEEVCTARLSGRGLSQIDGSGLSAFVNLVHVEAAENFLPLAGLGVLPRLRVLELPLNNVRSVELAPGSFPHLRVLNLAHNMVSSAALQALGALPKLESLDLSCNELETLPSLTAVSSDGLTVAFARLRHLILDDNRLDGMSACVSLAGLPRLSFLSLNNNRIAFIPYLEGSDTGSGEASVPFPALDTLSITHNRLSLAEDILELEQWPALAVVHLEGVFGWVGLGWCVVMSLCLFRLRPRFSALSRST
jgi:hypothetical protein